MRSGAGNILRVAKPSQDKIGKHDMFRIEVTVQEKDRINILSPGKLEIWFYKDLSLNRREYLDILCNRLGIPSSSKEAKPVIANKVSQHIVFET
jgi:hypothetical protein